MARDCLPHDSTAPPVEENFAHRVEVVPDHDQVRLESRVNVRLQVPYKPPCSAQVLLYLPAPGLTSQAAGAAIPIPNRNSQRNLGPH